jgi:hypothetical protein
MHEKETHNNYKAIEEAAWSKYHTSAWNKQEAEKFKY